MNDGAGWTVCFVCVTNYGPLPLSQGWLVLELPLVESLSGNTVQTANVGGIHRTFAIML